LSRDNLTVSETVLNLQGIRVLTTDELATRWNCSRRTLEAWRAKGKGPAFVHLMQRGNPVVYKLSAVEAWENGRLAQDGTASDAEAV
jgi:hypothetical protein